MSTERTWPRTAIVLVAAATALATSVAFLWLDAPSHGFAAALMIGCFIVGMMGRALPGPALVVGIGSGLCYVLAAVFATFSHHSGCKGDCIDTMAAGEAGLWPFVVIDATATAAFVVLVIAWGVARLASSPAAPASTLPAARVVER